MTPRRKAVILVSCCLSLLIVSMDATIVNVAIPAIRTDLSASPAQLQWVVDIYTLVLASLLMLAGAAGDRLGRRRVFQTGLALFAIGSLACSLAPSIDALIGARFLQGIGGSMLNPVALSIISQIFTGKVYTSTITARYVLPDEMQLWLQTQGFTLPDAVTADLATQMNAGDHVALGILYDSQPSEDSVRVGPTRAELPSDKPVFPTLRRYGAVPRGTRYEVFVAGASAYVPEPYDTVWETSPWEGVAPSPGRFHTRFARRLAPDDALVLDLEESLGPIVPQSPTLLRSDFRQGGEALGLVGFAPEPQMVEIPGSGARGSAWDLFLCILLGLTPLIYTPESWFLLWVGARAREALEAGRSAIGQHLWPLYAIGVAVFWVVTLEGTARIAATLPLLVGVLRLAWPTLAVQEPRVRVRFPAKKKKK